MSRVVLRKHLLDYLQSSFAPRSYATSNGIVRRFWASPGGYYWIGILLKRISSGDLIVGLQFILTVSSIFLGL